MKTDADLKREVQAELAWDPAVDATAIGASRSVGSSGQTLRPVVVSFDCASRPARAAAPTCT